MYKEKQQRKPRQLKKQCTVLFFYGDCSCVLCQLSPILIIYVLFNNIYLFHLFSPSKEKDTIQELTNGDIIKIIIFDPSLSLYLLPTLSNSNKSLILIFILYLYQLKWSSFFIYLLHVYIKSYFLIYLRSVNSSSKCLFITQKIIGKQFMKVSHNMLVACIYQIIFFHIFKISQ